MRPVRRAAITLSAATALALAASGPASAHEVAPTSGAAQLPVALVATAAGLVLLISIGLLAMARSGVRPAPAHVVAVALLFTGVAHCALVPEHWEEGWHLGVFFVLSGVILLGQAVALWRNPTGRMYASVIASTAVLLALYFLAREVALPLVAHRDPYLFEDLPVKAAELVAAALSAAALLPRPRTAYGDGPWTAVRSWAWRRGSAPLRPPPIRP